MKKSLLLLICILSGFSSCAQPAASDAQETAGPAALYRLFPTQNMWTFIKLNTSNGLMWRVQYSVRGDAYRFEEPISSSMDVLQTVSEKSKEQGESPRFYPRRFTLHSTQNMHNFLLLDQQSGLVWQVQYPRDSENIILISR